MSRDKPVTDVARQNSAVGPHIDHAFGRVGGRAGNQLLRSGVERAISPALVADCIT